MCENNDRIVRPKLSLRCSYGSLCISKHRSMSQCRELFASQSESGSSCDVGYMRGKGKEKEKDNATLKF